MKVLILLVIALAMILAGCATTAEPTVRTVTVSVPVPVRCKPNVGPAPTYPDTDEALARSADIFDATKLLLAGRVLRIGREAELSAALKACEG